MKFIADIMLGRLAKRMRLLGLDVLYDRTLDDNGIIQRSLELGRVILTRDRALGERPLAMNHLLIKSDHVQEQIEQVLSAFPLEPLLDPLSRCSECNETLAFLEKQDATDLVPPPVYQAHDRFLQCASCGRIYWKGSHMRKMMFPAGAKKNSRSGDR